MKVQNSLSKEYLVAPTAKNVLKICSGVFTAVFLIPVLLTAHFLPVASVSAATGINNTINFQGKLVDSNGLNVADNSYSVVFSIYSVSSGGSAIWTETQNVSTTDGLFQVQLGSITTLPGSVDFNTDNIYLGIQVGADAEMTPRIRFAAVPYAFNAQKVAGLTVTNTTGTLTIPNSTTIQFGAGFSTGSHALTLNTNGTTSLTLPTTGTLLTQAGAETMTNKTIGSTGLTFSGSGTDIATVSNEDFTITPNGSGDIILTSDSNTGVSIGSSANTQAVLSVSGGLGSNAALIVNNTNSGDLFAASQAGTTRFRVANNGDVVLSAGLSAGGTVGTNAQCLTGGATAAWTACSTLGTNYWQLNNGTVSPFSNTLDLLVGGTSSASAVFKVSPSGTSPTASVSGRTANAGLVVDNTLGDLFAASSSGLNRFVIKQNGNVGIGTSQPGQALDILRNIDGEASVKVTNANSGSNAFAQLLLANDSNANIYLGLGSSGNTAGVYANRGIFEAGMTSNGLSLITNDIGDDIRFITGQNTLANEKLRISGDNTSAAASVSANTSFAGMVVDNRGTGDLFTASSSGLNRFVIKQNGNVGIGMTNPGSELSVRGAIRAYDDGGDLADYMAMYHDGSNGAIDVNSGNLLFGVAGNRIDFAADGVSQYITLGDNDDLVWNYEDQMTNLFRGARGTLQTDSTLNIFGGDHSGGKAALIVNQVGASTNDIFAASASGTTRFVLKNNGNVGIGDVNPAEKLAVAGTITDTGSLQSLSMTVGNDANADGLTALTVSVTSASTGDADVVYGIDIDDLVGAGSTVSEDALRIGSGWDNDIEFADATPNIQLSATDNTSEFTFTDASSNVLLRMRDMSTNFGAALYAGAFINFNSMVAEEFNRTRTSLSADTTGAQNGAFGNGGGWGVYEGGTTPNCTFSTLADTVNGITRMAANAAATGCMTMIDDAINNAKLMYNVANLPIIVMKLRPSQADTNSAIYAGLGDSTDGAVAAPSNFIGFSNDNAGTLGNTWRGITRSGGTSTTVTCTGQTVSTTQFALLVIEVRSSSSVRFFMDNDVSNGVNLTECGSGSATNIYTSNLAPQIHWQERSGGAASNLDLDFYRTWQDDAPMTDGLTAAEPDALTFDESISGSEAEVLDTHDVVMGTIVQDEVAQTTVVEDMTGALLAGLVDPLRERMTALEDKVAMIETQNQSTPASSSASVLSTEMSSNSAEASKFMYADNLAVAGLATVSASLRVRGNSLIEGMLHVVDTLTVSNFIVNRLANFFGDVVFHSDVIFKGRPIFNSDTAGVAVIKKGSDRVDVVFDKAYEHAPVVSASLVLGQITKTPNQSDEELEFAQSSFEQKILDESPQYVLTRRTEKGFTILLKKPAPEPLTFSWTALATDSKNSSETSSSVNFDSPKQEDRIQPAVQAEEKEVAGQEGGDKHDAI